MRALSPHGGDRPIEQFELFFARWTEALETFAHHDTATRSGEHATTVMCDVNTTAQQTVKKHFASLQVQLGDSP